MAGTLDIPKLGQPNRSEDPKIVKAVEALNDLLGPENKVALDGLEEETKSASTWYAPKVIATEESRTNTAFGTLATADEITGVVLPENGLLLIGYAALVKSSTSEAGEIAVFLGSNQLSLGGAAHSIVSTNEFRRVFAGVRGLERASNGSAFVTTGTILSANAASGAGGLMTVFAAPGTYSVSVQYKANPGSITAKERKLWVAVLGG